MGIHDCVLKKKKTEIHEMTLEVMGGIRNTGTLPLEVMRETRREMPWTRGRGG